MVQPLVKTKGVKKFHRKFKKYQHDRKIAVKVRRAAKCKEDRRGVSNGRAKEGHA